MFAKTSQKLLFFSLSCAKMGPPWTMPKTEISKPDPKVSKAFYFNKISYVLAEL